MKKLIPSEKIYIAESTIVPLQRGVFAKKNMKQDEIIEVCPILEISVDDTKAIHEESLVSYLFYYGEKKDTSLIALGFGSLYNHTTNPNAIYKIEPDKKTITFTALSDIKKDEEITVNYAPDAQKPLWFMVQEKT